MHGAVAAGIHPDIETAARHMVPPGREVYQPNPAHRAVYEELYTQYTRLHNSFGRAPDSPMKVLKRLRAAAFAAPNSAAAAGPAVTRSRRRP